MMQRSIAGFRFGAITAGLKHSGRPDLAVAVAENDVPVAAVFTRNRLKGAPVIVSQERAALGLARAVIVHSGIANTSTGKAGIEAAQQITRAVAKDLGADERRVLIAGTGLIGATLPVEQIIDRTDNLLDEAREDGFHDFAEAILTTDKRPKVAWAEIAVGGARARILGCAKGSGMVAPNMATVLGFIFTDAAVDGRWLRGALKEEVEGTWNEVSVDGDTSPNDSLFVLASGRLQNPRLDGGPLGRSFRSALRDVLDELGTQLVRDGEGATRVVTIEVVGALDVRAARQVARRVGVSPLVKTAIAGADPNWGRILTAIGNAGVDLDPDHVDVDIGDVALVRSGMRAEADEAADVEGRAAKVMARESYTIRIHLHRGRAEARHITCDLTKDYVTINAEYRT